MGIFSSYSTPINTDMTGEKFSPYLRLPKKSVVYSVAIKAKGKQVI
jgi:hypothetical protein